MRPMREAVSKWWDNTEKNHEHFLWTQLQSQSQCRKGNDIWKNSDKYRFGLCMLISVKRIAKTPNLQQFRKTANMWTVLFMSPKQLPQSQRVNKQHASGGNQKQSFSSRLPEFLIETQSQDRTQLAICRITLKAQESFNPMALQNVDSSHNRSNILPNNTPCY